MTVLRIGFTGTKKGMTKEQKQALTLLLKRCEGREFHHGDCIGADAEAHDIAEQRGLVIITHPPTNPSKRAWKSSAIELKPKPYLDRNRDIATACDILIAAPDGPEHLRSGTWSTVRAARKAQKKILIIDQSGNTKPDFK